MRALVIGGSGFIGSHLVDALLQNGHDVRVFDRMPERHRQPPGDAEFIQGEFGDPASVAKALHGIDIVFHLLSTTVPATSNLDPVADIAGNLVNTVRLLELMREAKVQRLVFLSSGGTVYGIPRTDPVAEDHPRHPISSYGIVKSTIEQYLHMESHLHGLKFVALRASNPYGPRQGFSGLQGVIGTYLWNYARGEELQLWGNGSVVRDFIYVGDLVDLCVSAANFDQTGFFNAGSGQGHSISEIISEISAAVGEEIAPRIMPSRGVDVPRIVLDISRARTEFDWSPKIGLREGIATTWAWVQEQSR